MISLLVAYDRNRLIGKDNDLPWRLPNDLKYFKETTMGHTIIMGRKTYESIGKPLPGRKNAVITTQPGYEAADGVDILHSLGELEPYKRSGEEHFVIGGARIFEQVLPFADKLYITYIDAEFGGDTYFPEWDSAEWQLVSETKGEKNEKNPYDYYFRVYARK